MMISSTGRMIALLLLCTPLFSQESGTVPYLSFPRPLERGGLNYSLGASMTIFPRFVVEEEIRQIPMVLVSARYGLPSNFSLTAQFSTVYITNALSAGAMWSHELFGIHAALTDEFVYWFGIADLEGFNTNAMGIVNRPGISAGIDIDNYLVTLRSELLILISQHTYFGSASVGRVKPEVAGVTTSLTLEQDLWDKTFMSFSLRANIARPNYQLWLAFSVQDRWILYPEIQMSFLF
ncbi:MAG: hypothetical protein KA247_08835 [Bacteroidetes bacterium]|nr:hypothetical protein [Bacteroidota bacterium]